jgi:hypothetical protein
VPILDEGVLRPEVDAGPRKDGRCVGQHGAVVPAPPRTDVVGRKESFGVENSPYFVGRNAGTERLDDRRAKRPQTTFQFVQERPKLRHTGA